MVVALAALASACGGGTAAPVASPALEATATHTRTASLLPSAFPTATATTASARGELVVAANDEVGVLRTQADGLVVGRAPRMPAQYGVAAPPEVRVETFASALVVPWSMAFAPDGRLFVSERPGRIAVVDGRGALATWASIAASARGEGGLMGLALDPDFVAQPWVYVCYTVGDGSSLQNRISRVREVDGHGADEEILLERIPAANIHDGCRLKFGFDGKLYATSGDAGSRARAQDLDSLAGKILRLNPDGSIPSDNPFGSSAIFTYGHRNPQGLALDPVRRLFFATEHGPSGEVGFGAYDEVNVLQAGLNYGWPLVVGAPQRAELADPLLAYPAVAIAPAGATFYTSARIPEWSGNLFFTTLRGEHLQRVVLDPEHRRVVAIERLFGDRFGRLRDVIEGPDGALYVATSNRDGRGTPAAVDDRILRIVAAPPE